MATFDRYVLRFRAPLHLAGRGIGIETTELTVRSDTLFSALCVGLRETRGPETVADLLEWYEQVEPPFVLSSTFPWAGRSYFLPRPRIVPPGGPARRARWVSTAVLSALLRGDSPPDSAEPLDLGSEHTAWVLPDELAALTGRAWWATGIVTRVTVDRQTNAGAIFRAGRTVFAPDAGLYFLVLWRERAWESAFDDALAYLADAGLGGERNVGYGQFRVERDTITLDDAPSASQRVTLGLYHPTAADVAAGALDPPATYDLEVRRGWTANPTGGAVWRKAVRMLAEGALVQHVGAVAGDLVDVTPNGFADHRVVRCGMTLTLGMSPSVEGGTAWPRR